MIPIPITPATGDGSTLVFAAAQVVTNELLLVDRLPQIPTTDYASSIVGGVTIYTFVTAPVDGAVLSLFGASALTGTAGTLTKSGFATAGSIINRAAVQCGLASVTDPYASTDANFLQLQEFLTAAGEDLLSSHEWTHLIREAVITTASGATSYALPADFDRLVDQSEWNRSSRVPMIGPLTGPETQYLKARLASAVIRVAYRLQGNTITFPIAPSDNQTLAFEYVSDYWVWSNGGAAPDKTAPTASSDTILYDPELAIAALKLMWLEAKGFDTIAALERYQDKLERSISKNTGSRILNMGGAGLNADHLIDATNLPVTGFGT